MNEFFHSTLAFDHLAIDGVTDIEYFRMGFDFFLAVSTSGRTQFLFEFREGAFHLKQKLDVYRVIEMNAIPVPTCRDDVLLQLIRDDPSRSRVLYSWSAASRVFEQVTVQMANFRLVSF